MKSIRSIIIAILISGAAQTVMAQQDAMYSQYMFNTLAVNPAYAGSRNVTSATALYRDQWIGIEGAPRTATFTIDMPVAAKKVGLGLQIFNDKIGITNTTGAYVSYAYRIRFDKATLAFGIQGGVSQYRADLNSVALNTGFSNDASFRNNINKTLLNFGTGIYYSTDRFYLGFSSPQLLNNKLSDLNTSGNNAFSGQQLHLFLASGYVFTLDDDLKLKPSVLFKAVRGAPLQADINTTLWIKDALALGFQYRTEADVSVQIEFQVSSQIRLGYAYDRSTSDLVNYNSGSHEIMIRYEFGFPQGKILSPRYF